MFDLVAPAAKTPLSDQFIGMDCFDTKMLMEPDKLINAAIKGIRKDKLEIYSGLVKVLKIMSRLAPKFILSQTSKVGTKEMEG